jgi:hypothetical protein
MRGSSVTALMLGAACAFPDIDFTDKACSGICPLGYVCSSVRRCVRIDQAGDAGLCGRLLPNSDLLPGQAVLSCDGRFMFSPQASGEVTLQQGSELLWTSASQGVPEKLSMQGDGNLVLYTATNDTIWSTATYQHNGADLELKDDGNATIVLEGTVLWQTGTGGR